MFRKDGIGNLLINQISKAPVLILVLFVLVSCTPGVVATTEVSGSTALRGGTLRVAFPGTPGQLDPARVTLAEDYAISFAIYNKLVWIDSTLTPQPDLAVSWVSSDDLLRWTFKLRKEVYFQHGKVFTADDVVYTFSRILDPETASPGRVVLSMLDRVERVDDYTVRFHLKAPTADLATTLGGPQMGIAPSDYTDEQLSTEPSGTGPFKLLEYQPGDRVTLIRNENYWREGEDGDKLPYLDRIQFVYIPTEITQIAALSAKSVDMVWALGFENILVIEENPDLVIGEVQSGLYQPIIMRTTEDPFTDNRVRLALKYCIDREGILQVVTQGHGDLGNDQPISPIDPFWADIPPRKRDIAEARRLLAEAGYEDGLDLTLYTSRVRPGMVEQALAFQEMVKEAGIEVTISVVPTSLYWSEYWMKVPLFMGNNYLRPTANEALSTFFHSDAKWNEHDWKNPELDLLIEAARGEKDAQKLRELYFQAQKLISDQGGVIIAFYKPTLMAMRKEVQGFQPHPVSWMFFDSTWLSGKP